MQMCVKTVDQQVYDAIKSVVDAKCAAKETFTAFTITEEIRGQGFTEYHSNVKQTVHDGFRHEGWMTDYRKDSFDINGRGRFAIVYFHREIDPQDFVDALITELANQVDDDDVDQVVQGADGILRPTPMQKDTSQDGDAGAFRVKPNDADTATIPDNLVPKVTVKDVDALNRLRFTKPVLSAAGFDAGDQISVSFKNGSIVLGKPGDAGQGDLSGIHTVDEYTNLRLSLAAAGYTANSYRISVAGDRVLAHPVTV